MTHSRDGNAMNVYWCGKAESEVPPENDWLSVDELARLNRLRFPKRRCDWRLGRWTAKCGVASYLNLPPERQLLAGIEIVPASSGAPEVYIAGQPAAVTISLSHRDGRAACAVAPCGAQLGCDLEVIEPRSDAFTADYFTDEERRVIAHASPADRAWLVNLLWSAKESTLKAWHEGLRLDTRELRVRLEGSSARNGWNALKVFGPGGQVFHGWWQRTADILGTLVANPLPEPPIRSVGQHS